MPPDYLTLAELREIDRFIENDVEYQVHEQDQELKKARKCLTKEFGSSYGMDGKMMLTLPIYQKKICSIGFYLAAI